MSSKIEWTEEVWNPTLGCDRVSTGCDRCYAIRQAVIRSANPKLAADYDGVVDTIDGRADWTGKVNLLPHRLAIPLRWRRPRRVFVDSMSDLFHADVPGEFIARVFATMAGTPQHTYQILTKRHGRMRSVLRDICRCGSGHGDGVHLRSAMEWAATPHSPTYVPGLSSGIYHRTSWPLPNVWLGVSVEDQATADLRIDALLDTPAAVRWLSCEPLLGPVDLSRYLARGIDWVVVGGESGPGSRPMHPEWARTIRDQCAAARVPFLYKQHGDWIATDTRDPRYTGSVKGGFWKHDGTGWGAFTLPVPEAPAWMLRVGKKAAGRELDGREWNDYPMPSLADWGVGDIKP